jgi:hypothetical protein
VPCCIDIWGGAACWLPASGDTTPAGVGLWVRAAIDGLIVLIGTTSLRSCRPLLRATQQPWSAHVFQLGHAEHDTRIRAALLVQLEVVGQRSKKDVVVAVAVEPDEVDRAIAKRTA